MQSPIRASRQKNLCKRHVFIFKYVSGNAQQFTYNATSKRCSCLREFVRCSVSQFSSLRTFTPRKLPQYVSALKCNTATGTNRTFYFTGECRTSVKIVFSKRHIFTCTFFHPPPVINHCKKPPKLQRKLRINHQLQFHEGFVVTVHEIKITCLSYESEQIKLEVNS